MPRHPLRTNADGYGAPFLQNPLNRVVQDIANFNDGICWCDDNLSLAH